MNNFMRCASLTLTLLLLTGLTACSTKVIVPPVTMDAAKLQLNGKFVWFDLFTTDMTTAQNFYDRVFDWDFERANEGNAQVKNIMHQGQFVGNMIGRNSTSGDSQWLSYMSVADTDHAFDAALSAGATGYTPPKEMPNRGRIAVVIDPQKAPVALLHSPVGDPPDAKPRANGWIGAELWTNEVDEAVAFYTRLGGYTSEDVAVHDKVQYKLLLTDDRPRAGVVSIPWKDVDPQWVPYVAVENIKATVELIRANGGRILIEPQMDVRSGRVALFADPTGAVLGIQEMEPEED
ncbi:glyoxalase [Pseudodesulfovibrio nedwellii]|uniref:Glyoxalase n=1 Tax=Pseudodesulfovibrio nedwellii TaxID=2973072 RepID=A0ABN6S5Z6_9BACT|nr:VOC family protein [Pseudodesulfovibrio nedwellii]BDQ37689.1 glyoxalase [Pseudodesulfovibrio nedwellii]